jgi:hypothetical protein
MIASARFLAFLACLRTVIALSVVIAVPNRLPGERRELPVRHNLTASLAESCESAAPAALSFFATYADL